MPVSLLALMRALDHAVPRSVPALARALRCSETEARNGIDSLRKLGMDIPAVRGKGYRLALPFEPLDESKLKRLLQPLAPALDLQVLEQIDSTNAWLLRDAENAKTGRACIAEIQTAGRGRRGRSWYTVPGSSLAFSMRWRFERPLDYLAGLSLAAGVAVARVLHAAGAAEVRLKWPNDVLYRQRKLAGILVETQSGSDHSVAVVGVGINLRLPAAVRERIDQAVTDLAAAADPLPERNLLAARLLGELARTLEEFALSGFAGVREEWQALHAYQGQTVRVRGAGAETSGRVTGVAADGALLVATEAGERRYYGGDISLRAA
jgi:BirA family transcriptional regulator, biotin operon repressor / biotin---[acetyl-CoA-carboxylase] ligase